MRSRAGAVLVLAAAFALGCAAPGAAPQSASTPASPTPATESATEPSSTALALTPPPTRAPTPPAAATSPAARFTLRVGEAATLPGDPGKVVFEGVASDNRCAVDVQCVTAGEARITFRLDRPGALSISFELGTSRTSTATTNGYTVALLSVHPAPRSTVRLAPGDYTVEITVSR